MRSSYPPGHVRLHGRHDRRSLADSAATRASLPAAIRRVPAVHPCDFVQRRVDRAASPRCPALVATDENRMARPARRLSSELGVAAPRGAPPRLHAEGHLEAIVRTTPRSMSFSDPSDLRIRAMELLIDTQGNEQRTLGASSSAAIPALFGPGLIGRMRRLQGRHGTALVEDGGGTDYNAAFAAAGREPHRSARIFLTDGEHTAYEPFANGTGRSARYVIGLGIGSPGCPRRLWRGSPRRPAASTARNDDGELQAAMFDLNSAIACQAPPKRFTDGSEGRQPRRTGVPADQRRSSRSPGPTRPTPSRSELRRPARQAWRTRCASSR